MTMEAKDGGPDSRPGQESRTSKRSWRSAISISVAMLAVGIAVSATVNPLFGRAVHWDWMAVLAPVLLVAMTLVLRNRWA
jgi:hypothetical protein